MPKPLIYRAFPPKIRLMDKPSAPLLKSLLELISQGKYPEALTTLLEKKEALFADYPKRTLTLVYELAKAVNEPKLGEKAIAELAELPYVDQATEELFRELPKKLADKPGPKKGMGLEEAASALNSEEPAQLMNGLRYAKEHPLAFPSLRAALRSLCLKTDNFPYRQLALQILSLNHDEEPIDFAYGEWTGTFVPAELPVQSTVDRAVLALHALEEGPDAGIAETGKEILLSCLSAYYPFPLPEGDLAAATAALAKAYLGQKAELSELAERLDSALKSHCPA